MWRKARWAGSSRFISTCVAHEEDLEDNLFLADPMQFDSWVERMSLRPASEQQQPATRDLQPPLTPEVRALPRHRWCCSPCWRPPRPTVRTSSSPDCWGSTASLVSCAKAELMAFVCIDRTGMRS